MPKKNGRKLFKRIGKEVKRVERGIVRFEEGTKKFRKKIRKSPITRFADNLSYSLESNILGEPLKKGKMIDLGDVNYI